MAKKQKMMAEAITIKRVQMTNIIWPKVLRMGSQVNNSNRDNKKTHSNQESVSVSKTWPGTYGEIPTQDKQIW